MQIDLYSNPEGEGKWLKYERVFHTGYAQTEYVREGQFSELSREYGNRKYTHHIVALCQEMREMKSFRHLTTAEIADYVKRFKFARRAMGTDWYAVDRILDDIEIDPKRTICNIIVRSGVLCVCCDEMVLPRREIDEENYSECYEVKRGLEYRDTACWINKYHVPALCSECVIDGEKYYRLDGQRWEHRSEKYLLGAMKGLIHRKYGRAA